LDCLKQIQDDWKQLIEKNRIRNTLVLTPKGKDLLNTYRISHLSMSVPNVILFEMECMGHKRMFSFDENGSTKLMDDSRPFSEVLDVSEVEKRWLNELFHKLKPLLEQYREKMTDDWIAQKTNKLLNATAVSTRYKGNGQIEIQFDNGSVLSIPWEVVQFGYE